MILPTGVNNISERPFPRILNTADTITVDSDSFHCGKGKICQKKREKKQRKRETEVYITVHYFKQFILAHVSSFTFIIISIEGRIKESQTNLTMFINNPSLLLLLRMDNCQNSTMYVTLLKISIKSTYCFKYSNYISVIMIHFNIFQNITNLFFSFI